MSRIVKPKQKVIKPCGICPTERDPFDVAGATKPGRIVVGPDGKKEKVFDTIIGQRNIDVFWEHLPWGDAQVFFSRTATNTNPVAVGIMHIDDFTVPTGMVLGITSVVFRAIIAVNPLDTAGGFVFARDDYFISGSTALNNLPSAIFRPKISNAMIVDKGRIENATGALHSGFELLNTNIATEEVPFMVFAKQNQTFSVEIDFLQVVPLALCVTVGVQYQGVWIPVALYDKLKRQFRGR